MFEFLKCAVSGCEVKIDLLEAGDRRIVNMKCIRCGKEMKEVELNPQSIKTFMNKMEVI